MDQSNGNEKMKHIKNLPTQLMMAFVFSGLTLCLFQSSSIVTLSYDLPPGSLTELLVSAAEHWHVLMEKLGTAGLTEMVTSFVEDMHDQAIEQ